MWGFDAKKNFMIYCAWPGIDNVVLQGLAHILRQRQNHWGGCFGLHDMDFPTEPVNVFQFQRNYAIFDLGRAGNTFFSRFTEKENNAE